MKRFKTSFGYPKDLIIKNLSMGSLGPYSANRDWAVTDQTVPDMGFGHTQNSPFHYSYENQTREGEQTVHDMGFGKRYGQKAFGDVLSDVAGIAGDAAGGGNTAQDLLNIIDPGNSAASFLNIWNQYQTPITVIGSILAITLIGSIYYTAGKVSRLK